MSALVSAAGAVWHFVVGDDWVVAAGVIASLGLTAVLPDALPSWLIVPLAAVALLAASILRAARAAKAPPPT